jgi:predicted nucleotidyltransferase
MIRMPKLAPEVARQRAGKAAQALAADPRVKLVVLFGSAADPERRIPVRDVDVGIFTEPPLGLFELLDLRAGVVDEIGGEIDLVSLNDASVVLAHEVADTGRFLYADPAEREIDFITRARMRYFDFKPYLEEQWRLSGERLKERLDGRSG